MFNFWNWCLAKEIILNGFTIYLVIVFRRHEKKLGLELAFLQLLYGCGLKSHKWSWTIEIKLLTVSWLSLFTCHRRPFKFFRNCINTWISNSIFYFRMVSHIRFLCYHTICILHLFKASMHSKKRKWCKLYKCW